MSRPETLIIGAGPAGLAVAAALTQQGQRPLVLEQAERLAASWHGHYQRLHLHTHRRHSALPGLPIPASAGPWPSRKAVIEYLNEYARQFDLDIRCGERVQHIARGDSGWIAAADRQTWSARNLVIATGYTRCPVYPQWPGVESLNPPLLHSGDYVAPDRLTGQRVLVVGMGNSGAEIALDLSEAGRDVTVSVRNGVNVVPRQIAGLPIATVNRMAALLPGAVNEWLARHTLAQRYADLPGLGIRPLPYSAQCQMTEHQRVPLIDIGTIDAIRQGRIQVRPGVSTNQGQQVQFADGTVQAFDQVIAATGYRPRLGQLLGETDALDAEGTPRRSGEAIAPGLYLCGFRISARGMLYEIGQEAQSIAAAIAAAEAPQP